MGCWKRWALPPLALLLVPLLFAGCASSETEEIVEIGVEEMQAAREGPGGLGAMGRDAREGPPADREGRPQAAMTSSGRPQGGPGAASDGRMQGARQAAYEQVGEVEKIVGNEVTFLLQKQSGGVNEPTGETAAYLIPVGMQLSSGDYSSLSVGMLLGFNAEGDMIRDAALLRG